MVFNISKNAIGDSGGVDFSRIKICFAVDKEKAIFSF